MLYPAHDEVGRRGKERGTVMVDGVDRGQGHDGVEGQGVPDRVKIGGRHDSIRKVALTAVAAAEVLALISSSPPPHDNHVARQLPPNSIIVSPAGMDEHGRHDHTHQEVDIVYVSEGQPSGALFGGAPAAQPIAGDLRPWEVQLLEGDKRAIGKQANVGGWLVNPCSNYSPLTGLVLALLSLDSVKDSAVAVLRQHRYPILLTTIVTTPLFERWSRYDLPFIPEGLAQAIERQLNESDDFYSWYRQVIEDEQEQERAVDGYSRAPRWYRTKPPLPILLWDNEDWRGGIAQRAQREPEEVRLAMEALQEEFRAPATSSFDVHLLNDSLDGLQNLLNASATVDGLWTMAEQTLGEAIEAAKGALRARASFQNHQQRVDDYIARATRVYTKAGRRSAT